MSSCMMGLELLSSVSVDFKMDLFPFVELNIAFKWSVEGVQNNLTNFDGIYHFVLACTSLNFDNSCVMLLASRCWVNCRSIQDQKVWNVLLCNISKDFNNCSIVLNQSVVSIKDSISLWNMSGVVKDLLLLFGCPLLFHGNLVV